MVPNNKDLSTLTIDDIYADPKTYGLPTIEEFFLNPNKYRRHKEELLNVDSNGSQMPELRKLFENDIYEFEGYRAYSLEELERVIHGEGVTDTNDLEMQIRLIPNGNGKCDVLHFYRRKQRIVTDEQKLLVD